MVLAAVVLFVVVLIVVAVGAHAGPHGVLVAGVLAVLGAAALGLAASAGMTGIDTLGVAALAVSGAIGVASIAGAVASLRGAARRPLARRSHGLWGAEGVVVSPLDPVGTVRVRGENWTAESLSGPLPAGARIEVAEVDGLRLRVWPAGTVVGAADVTGVTDGRSDPKAHVAEGPGGPATAGLVRDPDPQEAQGLTNGGGQS
jgi:membrane-bound serine protease (ClpP class)